MRAALACVTLETIKACNLQVGVVGGGPSCRELRFAAFTQRVLARGLGRAIGIASRFRLITNN